MQKYNYKKIIINKNRGAAMMIFTLFVFFTSFIIIIGISRPALREFAITQNAFNSRQTYFLSESGVEDAFYRIKEGKSISASESLVLGDTTVTTTISDIGGGQKEISSLADTNSNQRRVKLVLDITQNSVVSLGYSGLHAGSGGVVILDGSTYTGDLYSSGPIEAQGVSTVTGNVVSGGSSGEIESDTTLNIGGDASAHTVKKTNTTGTIYCQSGTGNNKSCNTSQADPTVSAILDLSTEIGDWKTEAQAGGVYTGNLYQDSFTPTLGPYKIVGDLTIGDTLTLTGPLWVTGDINMISSSSKIKIDPTYGSADEVIIVDGTLWMGNWFSLPVFEGSGVSGSNVVVIGTKTGGTSTYLANLSGDVIFYSPDSEIVVYPTSISLKGIIAKKLQIGGGIGTAVSYVTGVTSLNFDKDTFGISSWQETQ
jgi:hypothetical protein